MTCIGTDREQEKIYTVLHTLSVTSYTAITPLAYIVLRKEDAIVDHIRSNPLTSN